MLAFSGLLLASCVPKKKLTAANQQIQVLNGRIDSLNGIVGNLNKQAAEDQTAINQLKTQNAQYGKEAEDCRKTKEAISQKLDNLNKNLAEHGTSMKQIREKAEAALAQLHDSGAEVTYKNGLVYVSMQGKLAFPSGSTKMPDMGKRALSVIADVLNEFPGVTAVIIGNTDSIPINKFYRDNWSLSTERANVIVRILKDKYKIDPVRLMAAGKGKYDPAADNATHDGRTMNRRTEIVFNPDLSRLWAMMDNPQ